uniref:Putative secreted protein n=1 Tax=Anopheles darlingi TaxID=43151 RepID=A0A2M4D533_ANODA
MHIASAIWGVNHRYWMVTIGLFAVDFGCLGSPGEATNEFDENRRTISSQGKVGRFHWTFQESLQPHTHTHIHSYIAL